MNAKLGPVIASRRYFRAGDVNPEVVVDVEIAAPVKSPDSDAFICSVRVNSPTADRIETVHGIDELQALLLAMGYLQAILHELEKSSIGSLNWAGGEAQDYGIRIPQFWGEEPTRSSG